MKYTSALQHQLRHRMQDKGLSANALEKRAGLKPSAVQNILQGKSKRPAASLLQAIANELNCTIDDILGEPPTPPQVTTSSKEKSNERWSSQHFVEAIQIVEELLERKGIQVTKEMTLTYADEVYRFSMLKSRSQEVVKIDQHFAVWLING